MTSGKQYQTVLTARFKEKVGDRFYYSILGDSTYKERFFDQKKKYSEFKSGELIYSTLWYVGKECPVCENGFNGLLFLNKNEHDILASVYKQMGINYWNKLANETGDKHWLSQNNNKF